LNKRNQKRSQSPSPLERGGGEVLNIGVIGAGGFAAFAIKAFLQLQFEKGEINLYEWIPVKMKLNGLLQKDHLKRLEELMGNLSVVHLDKPSVTDQKVQGRFNDIFFNEHVTIEYGNASEKQNRYSNMLIAMMQDQWNWIKDQSHERIIDDNNAVNSLRMAEQATEIAQKF